MSQSVPVVYFIECAGKIKIGFTKNLSGRLAQFRTAHPDEIKLIGHVPGSLYFERELHARLAFHAVKGEWFEDCPEVRGVIAQVMKGQASDCHQPVAQFMEELRTTTKASLPRSAINVLTSDQLRAFGHMLIARQRATETYSRSVDLAPPAAKEVAAILALADPLFKGLVADALYPSLGRTPEETEAFDKALTESLMQAAAQIRFNTSRAERVIDEALMKAWGGRTDSAAA